MLLLVGVDCCLVGFSLLGGLKCLLWVCSEHINFKTDTVIILCNASLASGVFKLAYCILICQFKFHPITLNCNPYKVPYRQCNQCW